MRTDAVAQEVAKEAIVKIEGFAADAQLALSCFDQGLIAADELATRLSEASSQISRQCLTVGAVVAQR